MQSYLQKNRIFTALTALLALVMLVGCERQPPAERVAVTLPVYTQGDAQRGKQLYDDNCEKCHKLQAGNNEKGPQLLRIYGAKAGQLSDYQYTDALKNSHLVWTADNLDRYINDPKKTVTGTRMRSKPVADAKDRQDIIAYVSTLR